MTMTFNLIAETMAAALKTASMMSAAELPLDASTREQAETRLAGYPLPAQRKYRVWTVHVYS